MILRVLLERETVSSSDLASVVETAVVSPAVNSSLDNNYDATVKLHHVHIPKLDAAGLVADADSHEALSLGSHPDVCGGPLSPQVLDSVDQEVWNALAAIYSHRRCSDVLAMLSRFGPTMTLEQATARLAEPSTQPADCGGDNDVDDSEHLAATLHHLHLPKLDDVGLVDYDASAREVSYTGNRWFPLSELVDALDHSVTSPSQPMSTGDSLN